jgi:adenylate kinase family enzyme
MKIHILCPSGSGTSTLGQTFAQKHNIKWFDSDKFFWEDTDPPFSKKRAKEDRIKKLQEAIANEESWILSGSIMGWGDFIKEQLDIAIYLYINKEKRIKRLLDREREHFGKRIEYGNDMYENHKSFIEWASSYEDGSMDIRSRESEEYWMKDLKCKIVRIEEEKSVEEEIKIVENCF